jgi:hypothetical protein
MGIVAWLTVPPISLGFASEAIYILDRIYPDSHQYSFNIISGIAMKKILTLVAVFALTFGLNVANAQDKPKTASKKATSSCCDSKAKANCDSEAKANCGTSAKQTKKMAAKHVCGDKCGDGCKSAQHVESKETKKN